MNYEPVQSIQSIRVDALVTEEKTMEKSNYLKIFEWVQNGTPMLL